MNIYEALKVLDKIYDSNAPYMSDEETEEFADALEAIEIYVQDSCGILRR